MEMEKGENPYWDALAEDVFLRCKSGAVDPIMSACGSDPGDEVRADLAHHVMSLFCADLAPSEKKMILGAYRDRGGLRLVKPEPNDVSAILPDDVLHRYENGDLDPIKSAYGAVPSEDVRADLDQRVNDIYGVTLPSLWQIREIMADAGLGQGNLRPVKSGTNENLSEVCNESMSFM